MKVRRADKRGVIHLTKPKEHSTKLHMSWHVYDKRTLDSSIGVQNRYKSFMGRKPQEQDQVTELKSCQACSDLHVGLLLVLLI